MRLLVVDTETGGVNPTEHSLLQIGAIAVERYLDGTMEEVGSFEALVKPHHATLTTVKALEVNHLDLSVVERDGQSEKEALTGLIRFASHYRNRQAFPILIGWNLHFDIDFLKAACERNGLPWPFYFIDFDVSSIWKFYNIFQKGQTGFKGITGAARELLDKKVPHTALGDVRLTFELLQLFVSSGGLGQE